MEIFEELSTANFAVHQVQAGVDILEKGAFERGLPEIEKTYGGPTNHQMHDNLQQHPTSALANEPIRKYFIADSLLRNLRRSKPAST